MDLFTATSVEKEGYQMLHQQIEVLQLVVLGPVLIF